VSDIIGLKDGGSSAMTMVIFLFEVAAAALLLAGICVLVVFGLLDDCDDPQAVNMRLRMIRDVRNNNERVLMGIDSPVKLLNHYERIIARFVCVVNDFRETLLGEYG